MLQMELARRSNPGRIPRSFEFRALSPVYAGGPFSVQARREADSSVATWIADGKGGLAQQGKATFR
jgi:3-methylfumaryl-CoA hydratase